MHAWSRDSCIQKEDGWFCSCKPRTENIMHKLREKIVQMTFVYLYMWMVKLPHYLCVKVKEGIHLIKSYFVLHTHTHACTHTHVHKHWRWENKFSPCSKCVSIGFLRKLLYECKFRGRGGGHGGSMGSTDMLQLQVLHFHLKPGLLSVSCCV